MSAFRLADRTPGAGSNHRDRRALVSSSPFQPTARDCGRAILEAGAKLEFSPPSAAEALRARAMAESLMGQEVASIDTIQSVLTIQPGSSLIFREEGEVTGMVATLLLKPSAEPDLLAARFEGLAPPASLLGVGDDPIAFYYVWGIAGATKRAGSAVMQLSRRLRYDSLASLTAYAFAATPAGRHVGISQLAFRPVRHPDDDLLVSDPVSQRWAA